MEKAADSGRYFGAGRGGRVAQGRVLPSRVVGGPRQGRVFSSVAFRTVITKSLLVGVFELRVLK